MAIKNSNRYTSTVHVIRVSTLIQSGTTGVTRTVHYNVMPIRINDPDYFHFEVNESRAPFGHEDSPERIYIERVQKPRETTSPMGDLFFAAELAARHVHEANYGA